ncbi:MAG: hypothetical protein Q8R23_01945, partial [Methylotenera sp.]|nr:hypothetical protein [Methylotenera sp.]
MMFWILVGLMSLLALAFVLIPIVKPGVGRKPLLIITLVIAVPLVAVLTYQQLGMPTATTQSVLLSTQAAMPEGHPDTNIMNMDFAKMADGLAQKLKVNPD